MGGSHRAPGGAVSNLVSQVTWRSVVGTGMQSTSVLLVALNMHNKP